MKKLYFTLLCCLLAAMTSFAQDDTQAPAFPGAEGHGRYTTGGREGEIRHVTNLNDTGTGSFREAVKGDAKKIVVFDVGGIIKLNSNITIGSNTTILGQTAPGEGITLRYYTLGCKDNCVIRFIRIRRGQEKDINDGADAFFTRHQKDIIIDHCSFSWGIDECFSFYDNHNTTLQWSTVGEGLANSGHTKGEHCYGGIWGGKGASFHHNLIIHFQNRTPRLNGARYGCYVNDEGGITQINAPTTSNGTTTYDSRWEKAVEDEQVDIRNLVIYNKGNGNGAYAGMGGYHNYVNNYYKVGPATTNGTRVFQMGHTSGTGDDRIPGNIWGHFLFSGNDVDYATFNSDKSVKTETYYSNRDWDGVIIDNETSTTRSEYKLTSPISSFKNEDITTHTAKKAYEKVVQYAGASLVRDAVDTRYADETTNRTTHYIGSATQQGDGSSVTHRPGIIDIVADQGTYILQTASRPSGFDTDGDGMPDEWETANGLNPNSNDANLYTIDNVSKGGKGWYTNIEVYANSLVEDIMKNENKDALSSVNEYYPTLAGGSGGGDTGGDDTPTYTQTNVSEAKTWDWSKISGSDIQWSASTTPSNTDEVVMKNIPGLTFDSSFDAQSIVVKGEFPYRGGKTQNTTIKFHTTVAGTISVDFSDTGSSIASGSTADRRYLNVNGTNTTYYTQRTGSSNDKKTDCTIEVPAGDVVIKGMKEDGTSASAICIYKIVFTPSSSTPSTPTTVDGTETTPTAKTSNEDFVGLCYTVPGTYVGGQGNSSKAIKFNLRDDKIVINVNPNYTITGFTFTGNDNYADNGITISSVTVDGGSANVLGSSVTFNKDKSENSFTVSNINATQNITITAATPHDNQLNGTIVFTYKYNVQPLALQSSAKTSSRNGSVTLKFNNPMAAVNGTATLNGKTLTADADGTSLKFVYTGLNYGQTYTFTVPAGALKDEFNQTYDQPISITVTTDARATVTKKGFDKIVSDGTELAAAIAEANGRADKTLRYRIFVKKGAHILPTNGTTKGTDGVTYPDPRTHLSGANVSIIGEDYNTTSFTNITPAPVNNACPLEGIGNGDVLIIDKTATESYFQGVTIRTSMGDAHGRDIAVNDQSNKTIMKDCRLWGYQDTYVSNNSNGRFYFDGGVLRGRTDYLCGKGDVYYNKVTLQQVGTGGYLAVPSVPLKYGYIFNECYIKKETSDVTYYLGRPWGNGTPIALFINTKVDAAPIAAGWAEMSNGWPDRFAEYGTKTTSGTAVSTSGRKTTFATSHTNNPVLTATEAEYYSNMARIMGGTDGWDPTIYTEQCAKPTAQLSGSTLTWNDDSYASSWVVFKDGEYYANPISNSLALSEAGTYTVRAANAMGGLGEASTGVTYTDMSAGGATLAFTASVQGGSNAAGSFVNQETHYYNNWGGSGWAAQAYIGFDVTVPEGKQVKSATLKFTSNCGGNYDGRSVDVYLLSKDNTTAFNTSNMSLSAANGTKVSTETDNRTESLKTVTLGTDAIAALNEIVAADATSRVIFQLGGAVAGATLYGYASAKAPTLDVEFEDIPAQPVTNIIVSPANKTIAVGETLQLSAQVLPAGANQSVTWRSDDTNIATVDATTGKVTANNVGTVNITATATDGSNVSDFCILTVVEKQSGNTEVVYSWESPSGTVSQYGGNIVETPKSGETAGARINYRNTALGTNYYTISLTGSNDFSNQYMTITLSGSETIKKDDVIRVTAYRNKNEAKYSSAKFKFANNQTMIIGGDDGSGFVNLNAAGDTPSATEPNTISHTVTEAEAGGNTLKITRGITSTNLFITKIEIVRESSAPSTPTTITKYISSAEWASFVPSENVVVPSGVKVYYAKTGSYDGSSVVAVPVAEGETIAKNTGFFINGTEGNYLFNVSTATPLSITDNMLSCGANATIANGSLVFGRNYINDVLTVGFFPLTSYDILLPEGIVYIDGGLLKNKAPQAISVIFDDATGIRSANEATSYKQATGIYNLSGQKVDANYKGIVIINGKKVLKR